MYEEIDLRPYLNILWKNRLWLLLSTIGLGAVAFFASQLLPPKYETTALVVAGGQSDLLQFDSRISSGQDQQLIAAYPELAMSDAVVLGLLNRLDFNDITLSQMQKLLIARAGTDSRIIQLVVEQRNPEMAAKIANAWAVELIEWTNILYDTQAGETLAFYENELATAESTLQQAENDLATFQGINQTAVFSNTLKALYQTQADTLLQLDEIDQLAQDTTALQQLFEEDPTIDFVYLNDQLTLLNLQAKVFNADAYPVFLQTNEDVNLSSQNRDDQIARLNGLIAVTTAQAYAAEQKLVELEPQILSLQQQVQMGITEHQRLIRNQLVAEENYLTLARKVSEERISVQDSTPPLRLISEAPVPDDPINNNTLSAVVVASILGFTAYAAILIFLHWWRNNET